MSKNEDHEPDLPYSKIYQVQVKQPLMINLTLFLFFSCFFSAFGLMAFGIIIGATLAFGLAYYDKKNNPGLIKHVRDHWRTPVILSGNKYRSHNQEE